MIETIFTVKNEHIDRLKEVEAVELFREILWSEAFRTGLPSWAVNVSLRTKVPDGGLDASARNDEDVPSNIFNKV